MNQVKSTSTLDFKVEEKHRNVHRIRHKYKFGWEQWYLLLGCIHWDNPSCKWDILKRHLGQAQEKDAGIFSFGDHFCAMQGKYDKRSNKAALRPEHQTDRYLDTLIDTAVEWWGPYAENLVLISEGNHETAIQKRHETNLTERFVSGLNLVERPESPVCFGGYGGWVQFLFEHASGGKRFSFNMKYYHGSGGGGPVTHHKIQSNRRAVYIPNADFIVTAHIHQKQIDPYNMQEWISNQGDIYGRQQWHIVCSTYKEEYFNKQRGFHIERGGSPRPLGGIWLRFYYESNQVKYEFRFTD